MLIVPEFKLLLQSTLTVFSMIAILTTVSVSIEEILEMLNRIKPW